jgi:hypothetical protein
MAMCERPPKSVPASGGEMLMKNQLLPYRSENSGNTMSGSTLMIALHGRNLNLLNAVRFPGIFSPPNVEVHKFQFSESNIVLGCGHSLEPFPGI